MQGLTTTQITDICSIINDFISGEVDVKAIPGDLRVAWVRVYPQGEYPFAQNEAFQRLVMKGYNPQKLLDYAIAQATQAKTISTSRARQIAATEFGWTDTANTATRIRKAALRGAIKATNDPIDGWRYDEADLRRWMSDETAHKSGPRPKQSV